VKKNHAMVCLQCMMGNFQHHWSKSLMMEMTPVGMSSVPARHHTTHHCIIACRLDITQHVIVS